MNKINLWWWDGEAEVNVFFTTDCPVDVIERVAAKILRTHQEDELRKFEEEVDSLGYNLTRVDLDGYIKIEFQ